MAEDRVDVNASAEPARAATMASDFSVVFELLSNIGVATEGRVIACHVAKHDC